MVGTVHYTYTLECGHTVIANVPENDTKSAYKMGQLVVCPQDHFAKKKIIDQSSSVSP